MLNGSILQKLRDAHHAGQPAKRSLNFGVYYKNTLVALCHALEDAILSAEYNPLMITAFQRGRWYLQEAERYADLAAKSQQVVIMAAPEAGFAEHPTSQRQNVALVDLAETDPVAQEWHLIIVSPTYTAMVLCQELSLADYGAAGFPSEDLERKFYGFWTFEPSLVQETAELAIAHIGDYNPELQQRLTQQLNAIKHQAQDQSTADHLGDIVSRVVEYLQIHQAADIQLESSLDDNLTSNELQAFLRMAQLIDQTDLSNPMAAAEVAALAETLGQLVDLPAWQLHRLRLAGLLHRIALLPNGETVLTPERMALDHPEDSVPLSCPLTPGVQVLRRMQRLKAVATILTHQSEWWNGTGQPARLAADEIPVESRILGLVSAFQQELAYARNQGVEDAFTQALAACRRQEGDRWDPKLVEALTLLVNGFKQGLDLPVTLPKIAAGLWMLDSHAEEELLSYWNTTDIAGKN